MNIQKLKNKVGFGPFSKKTAVKAAYSNPTGGVVLVYYKDGSVIVDQRVLGAIYHPGPGLYLDVLKKQCYIKVY